MIRIHTTVNTGAAARRCLCIVITF